MNSVRPLAVAALALLSSRAALAQDRLADRCPMDGDRTGELGWALAERLTPRSTEHVLAHQAG